MKSTGSILVLADGRTFEGDALGAHGTAEGEVVFTTGMAGYQETLTDPSFAGQIITFTYPHIGSYGVNDVDPESRGVFAVGAIIRDPILDPSNQRATGDLQDFMRHNNVVGITGIDTRALTRHIRNKGSMAGLVHSPFDPNQEDALEVIESLKAQASQIPSMAGRNLAHEVSCSEPYEFTLRANDQDDFTPDKEIVQGESPHVVVYDFGMKRNMAASLARRGAKVTVVPAKTPAEQALSLNPDGILLSNGPGDPDAVEGAPELVQSLLGKVPLFGICLGHQIMALALGAKTYKMKFGHRGVNQPVQAVGTHRVYITSQNHGFCVDEKTLPKNAVPTFLCPNDGTLEGFAIPDKKLMAVQFHPEACPGPHDTAFLFDDFIAML